MQKYLALLLITISVAQASMGDTIKDKLEFAAGFVQDTARDLLPGLAAIDQLNLHAVDIHFYTGDINHQYIAHHFCTYLNEDFMQCALFDNPDRQGHIIGTEFIITKKLFEQLPEEEKPLWHSHVYEVKSGLFVLLGLNPIREWHMLEWMVNTYGKVIDVWHDGDDRPLGAPQLAFALAMDEQVDWALVDEMDRKLHLASTHKQRRENRAKLGHEKAAGADQYLQTGKIPQFKTEFLDHKPKTPNNGNGDDDL